MIELSDDEYCRMESPDRLGRRSRTHSTTDCPLSLQGGKGRSKKIRWFVRLLRDSGNDFLQLRKCHRLQEVPVKAAVACFLPVLILPVSGQRDQTQSFK